MNYVVETLDNLVHQTAFFNLTVGNYIMIVVALVFLYLAIGRGFEPLLLVPIAFGMLLVNIYPDIMAPVGAGGAGGGLLYYFYLLDEWAILPSLIFMGVGAMTDFGPLIANPKSFLLGAAAQFGIFAAYFGAIFLGFNDKAAAAISIIGGGDSAIDAVCSSLACGADKAVLAYRRSREEMPACDEEFLSAADKGVELMYMVSPVSITAEGDGAAVTFVRNRLVERPGESRKGF